MKKETNRLGVPQDERRARLEEALQAAGLGRTSATGTLLTVVVLLVAFGYGVERGGDWVGVVLIVVSALGLLASAASWLLVKRSRR